MDSFPMAVVTSYPKHNGFKQPEFIISQFWRSKILY